MVAAIVSITLWVLILLSGKLTFAQCLHIPLNVYFTYDHPIEFVVQFSNDMRIWKPDVSHKLVFSGIYQGLAKDRDGLHLAAFCSAVSSIFLGVIPPRSPYKVSSFTCCCTPADKCSPGFIALSECYSTGKMYAWRVGARTPQSLFCLLVTRELNVFISRRPRSFASETFFFPWPILSRFIKRAFCSVELDSHLLSLMGFLSLHLRIVHHRIIRWYFKSRNLIKLLHWMQFKGALR